MPTEPASLTRTRSSMYRLTWLIAEEALLFATLGVIHSGRIIVEPQLLLSALTTGLFMLRQYCSRRSGIFWGACRPERNQNPCRRIENPWAAAGRLSAGDIRRSPYCRSYSPLGSSNPHSIHVVLLPRHSHGEGGQSRALGHSLFCQGSPRVAEPCEPSGWLGVSVEFSSYRIENTASLTLQPLMLPLMA